MNIVKYVLKRVVKMPEIESFDNYLFVGPHPDDIEIGAGATIAKLAKENKRITFLICTDGRYGDDFLDGIKGDELAALRKAEAIKSAALLGVSDVRFLDLKDGACYTQDELYEGIAGVVSDVKPDIVFAPDSLSKSECHPDHINVGNAVKAIACLAPHDSLMREKFGVPGCPVKALALYMTSRPNRYVRVKNYIDCQLKAIFDCHTSQYRQGDSSSNALKLYIKLKYFQYGCREGFRVYTQTHMHCCPEAE